MKNSRKIVLTICLLATLFVSSNVVYTDMVQSYDSFHVTTMTYPTTNKEFDFLLLEKFFPKEIKVGEPFEYVIKFTNLRDVLIGSVRVCEVIEQEKYLLKESTTKPHEESDGKYDYLHFYIGDLKPKETKELRIKIVLKEAGPLRILSFPTYQILLSNTLDVRE